MNGHKLQRMQPTLNYDENHFHSLRLKTYYSDMFIAEVVRKGNHLPDKQSRRHHTTHHQ